MLVSVSLSAVSSRTCVGRWSCCARGSASRFRLSPRLWSAVCRAVVRKRVILGCDVSLCLRRLAPVAEDGLGVVTRYRMVLYDVRFQYHRAFSRRLPWSLYVQWLIVLRFCQFVRRYVSSFCVGQFMLLLVVVGVRLYPARGPGMIRPLVVR